MIFDALIKERKIIKILEAIPHRKPQCRTGEALIILEDLEYELEQELKSAQAWLGDLDNG